MIKEELMRQHTDVSELVPEMYQFDRKEVSYLVYGSKEKYRTLSAIENKCAALPIIHNHDRREGFRLSLERGRKLKENIAKFGFPKVDYMNNQFYGNMQNGLYPANLSHAMFEALIRVLGSDDQVEKYLQDTIEERIIGWYAQTEIGHGSDVKGLETLAVFDQETQEFVVNTPTVTAIKFWPGDLGKMAWHAVFHARLISHGKDYGVNAFICRIREKDSHIPLKGIEVGDIGPKYGYFTKDNGYMSFSNFRIPKDALLSRYTSISREGEIKILGDPKVAYSVMLSIRSNLLKYSYEACFKICVIR